MAHGTTPPGSLTGSAWGPFIGEFVSRVNGALQNAWHSRSRGSVTSWWRSAAANKRLGGDEESQHLFALGVDLVLDPLTEQRLFQQALPFGLTIVGEGSHVHIQQFPAGALRNAGVTFPSKGNEFFRV